MVLFWNDSAGNGISHEQEGGFFFYRKSRRAQELDGKLSFNEFLVSYKIRIYFSF